MGIALSITLIAIFTAVNSLAREHQRLNPENHNA